MPNRLEQLLDSALSPRRSEPCYWWNGEWRSTGDFLRLADACERTLSEAGFSEGQRLVVMMKNSPMIPALSLAVWRLGGAFCPLNVAAGLESLSGTLKLIEPFAVVLSPDVKPEVAEAFRAQGWPCAECAPEGPLPAFKGRATAPETPDWAVIFATSGTTGSPKAVPLTHGNLMDQCEKLPPFIDNLSPDNVFLTVLPNFHSFGYTCANLLPLSLGARMAIAPSFLPPQLAMRAIAEAGVDTIFAVPAIYAYLLMAIEKGKFPAELLARQKILCSGGDRLNPKLHEEALRLLGRDSIFEGYGLTETSPVVAVNHGCETARNGTVGPFLTGFEHRLRTRSGEAAEGDEGVLWVRGPSVTPGYFRAPEITAERFDADGWFNTGDYVRVEDGFVTILDRVTDILIVGGFNVYPQEVEKILAQHPAVQTAIVVGVPHAINGEVPKAYVQLREGMKLTDRDLVKFAKARLAHFKVPRSVEFLDDFPLSATGKVLRRVLRERAKESR